MANDKQEISNNKFIYRDKFSRNGWLNMMNERLQLAKQLLKEDGVIFVSIDDNEQAYLKILMDEIFGEENFIANIIWNKGGGKSDSNYLSIRTEYVLTYAKNKKISKLNKKNSDINSYKLIDERGRYTLSSFSRQGLTYTKSLDYPISAPDGSFIYPGDSYDLFVERQNGNFKVRDWRWTLSREEFNKRLKNNEIVFINKNIKGINKWKVYYKSYFEDKQTPFSNYIEEHTNAKGSAEIKNIFNGERIFDFPKNIGLLMHIINLNINKNARILDFFAGSGTTGHAVLELNKKDGGSRIFTLVTNNENDIATNITYERLYRINRGVGTNGELFEWSKKNEPYNSNLSVFNINYLNIGLNEINQLNKLLKDVNKMLKDFGVKNIIQDSNNLLSKLRSLKPLEDK
ncbi:site-specific DNA-methyltransferase [Mycoplasmopsis columbina]